jgi:hypothetical protein
MSKHHEVVNELADNIVLHSHTCSDPVEYKFHISNTADEILHFTFDFSKSQNLKIVDALNPLITSVSMKPHTQSVQITLVKINPDEAHDISLATGWDYEDHDAETLAEYKEKWDDTVELLMAMHLPEVELSDGKTREEMAGALQGHDFIDKAFPPKNSALYQVGNNKGNRASMKLLAYRRPSQYSMHVSVFGDKIAPDDVILGSLPDVWLISTLANLADFPAIISSMFPDEFCNTHDSGIYKVVVYRCGIKTTVILDDFFPCFLNAGPAYSRTKSNALWVLLIEKAFAKSYGSYSALATGTPFEALIDLTGSPAKCIRFDDIDVKAMILDGSLFKLLSEYHKKGYILTVSSGVDT